MEVRWEIMEVRLAVQVDVRGLWRVGRRPGTVLVWIASGVRAETSEGDVPLRAGGGDPGPAGAFGAERRPRLRKRES